MRNDQPDRARSPLLPLARKSIAPSFWACLVVLHSGRSHGAPVDQASQCRKVCTLASTFKSWTPLAQDEILLEHTAGQGSAMGASFEEIGAMLDGVKNKSARCMFRHLPSARLPRSATEEGYRSTFDKFDDLIGFDRRKSSSGNDSKKPRMSRQIAMSISARGEWARTFRRLLKRHGSLELPMILETEKSMARSQPDPNRSADEINLHAAQPGSKRGTNDGGLRI